MTIKLEAAERLLAQEVPPVLELKIQCGTMDAYHTLVNLLGVIQWNCGVGHSATVGAFFDGDGADKIQIEGLPEGEYKDMAEAISAYGDDLMGRVGPHSAQALYTHSGDHYKSVSVYPPEDTKGD